MLQSIRSRLDDETYWRCEHVASEEERVRQTVAALETGDLAAVRRCLTERHAWLRDLYDGRAGSRRVVGRHRVARPLLSPTPRVLAVEAVRGPASK
jgi:ketosteroid isomerase-like protein